MPMRFKRKISQLAEAPSSSFPRLLNDTVIRVGGNEAQFSCLRNTRNSWMYCGCSVNTSSEFAHLSQRISRVLEKKKRKKAWILCLSPFLRDFFHQILNNVTLTGTFYQLLGIYKRTLCQITVYCGIK